MSEAERTMKDVEVIPDDTARSKPQRRGPKTAAGKARIGLNAIKYGLTSTRLILPSENATDWETFRQAIVDDRAPVGPVETVLAERVASAAWRLRRLTAYEDATLAERQHLKEVSARLLPHPNDLDKIIRYEAHLNRQLYQALHELEAMRAARCGQSTPLVRMDVQGLPAALPTPTVTTT
jgi:hypothetical protein